LLTENNTADFIPKEQHLRRKLVLERILINDSDTAVCEGGEHHPIVRILRRSINEQKTNISILIGKKRMFAVATEKSKILFANYFEVNSDEDILYYLLAICEHMEFQASQTLLLSESAVPELVKKYFEVR